MRTILFIIQKEFIQVFRNKAMLPIIFVVPIVQLLILVNAATFEMKTSGCRWLTLTCRTPPEGSQQVQGISIL